MWVGGVRLIDNAIIERGAPPRVGRPEGAMTAQDDAGKIHRATVTGADLDYEGCVTIDRDLMDAADLADTRRCTCGT